MSDLINGMFGFPFAALVFVILGVILIFAVRAMIARTLGQRIKDDTARYRSRKLVEFGSYIVIVGFVATVYSEYLGGVSVVLGVAGAGIAFALQEIVTSAAGGVALMFGNFYKVGDRVSLGGIKGDVIDIGFLRTTVFEIGAWVNGDLYNGRVVRLANSFIFKEPVYNYSADFPFLWDEVTVPVRHGSDRGAAQTMLESVLEEVCGDYAREVQSTWDQMTRNFVIEHARVAPMVTFVMDENWMTYTLRYPVEFAKRRTTKDALFRGVLDRFDASGGAVELASSGQEITVVGPSVLDVALREQERS